MGVAGREGAGHGRAGSGEPVGGEVGQAGAYAAVLAEAFSGKIPTLLD